MPAFVSIPEKTLEHWSSQYMTGQLWDYLRRPRGHQPFYVFPWPDWTGDLETAARDKGLPITEMAFSRSGPGSWFADWLVVLTTAQVAPDPDGTYAAALETNTVTQGHDVEGDESSDNRQVVFLDAGALFRSNRG
ncbi:MAG TPA: hypothetical protein VGP26_13585 [Actinophytocola sp.]|nr:hypothetical protein [Actinophytocola sp.]